MSETPAYPLASAWSRVNGISLNGVDGVSPSGLESLLQRYPGLAVEQLKQLSRPALEGRNFSEYAFGMLSQFGAENNTFTYYVSPGGDSPYFDKSGISQGFNTIFPQSPSLAPGEEYSQYIRNVMSDYQSLLGGKIKFLEVPNDNEALISFYRMPPAANSTVGFSLDTTNGYQNWRTIYYSQIDGPSSDAYKISRAKRTIRHEMGHTLGLRHPVDLASELFPQETVLQQSGRNSGFSSDDTMMSYNVIPDKKGLAPNDFTVDDVIAYATIWANFEGDKDLTSGNIIYKSDSFGDSVSRAGGRPLPRLIFKQDRDYITGLPRGDWFLGDQSDDTWHGGDGDDNYIYKGGFDFASGQDGRDTFHIDPLNENGYLTINDFTAGQDRLVFQSDDDYSIFSFGGATFVLGSDTDKVVFLKGEFTEQQLLGHAGAQLGIA